VGDIIASAGQYIISSFLCHAISPKHRKPLCISIPTIVA
jgi:hypothetical protein